MKSLCAYGPDGFIRLIQFYFVLLDPLEAISDHSVALIARSRHYDDDGCNVVRLNSTVGHGKQ